MTISVSGLGSGLDYSSWIDKLVQIKQNDIDKVSAQVTGTKTKGTTLSTVKSSYSSLLSSIEALNSITQKDSPFSQKTATSSDKAVSASVDAYASAQNIKVSVSNLATATSAKSASVAAAAIKSDTTISSISEGSVTAGQFSIYVNNNKYSIDVATNSTLGSVLQSITDKTGLAASVDTNGKVTIGSGSSASIVIGAGTDTSNFANVLALSKNEDGSFTSSKPVFTTNTSAALTSASFANGTVKAGTFKIGTAEFTIGSSTTLDSLVTSINNNKDAGVSAYWDSNSGKLVMESTNQGALNINVEAGTSNFTDIMGLTSSTWNTDGTMATTKLASGSQTLGTNASLTINGTTITSTSNTITSDISGLTGVTLTLNDETTSTATVAVSNDTSKVTDALNTFISAFNDAISQTDTATQTGGDLHGESILNSLRNRIRTLVSANTGTGTYTNLASIGITTGKIGTSVNANTNKLTLNADALSKALANDPDAVKKLLIGDDSTGSKGVLTNMGTELDKSMALGGYFAKRADSYSQEINRYNDKIDRMTTAMNAYKSQLEVKFSAMDKIISNMKNQASIIDSYLGTSISSSTSGK